MSIPTGLAIYLGYFTVLTNMLVGVAATAPLLGAESTWGRFFQRPEAIGWVAVSIAFVGVSYFVLLRHVWNPQGLQLVADIVMHYVVPIAFAIYSLMALRGQALRWSAPFRWSLYPLIYFVYVLIRGELLGRYPYGFIDVLQLGYARTLRNAVFLWIAFIVLAYVLMLIWRAISPRGRTRP
nr:Pr6Pr family membrane protein [Dyella sp. 2HG41-7]